VLESFDQPVRIFIARNQLKVKRRPSPASRGILFRVLVLAFVLIGSVAKVSVVWAMADVFMPLLALTNLIAIVPLAGTVARLLKHYRDQRRQGVEPVFHRDDMPDLKNIECWDGSDHVTRAETYGDAAVRALKN
jgi:AGCS family alanine or glycine:cation symporter